MRTHTSLSAFAYPILLFLSSVLAQSSSQFGVIAIHSDSPIHLQPLTASGQAFWLIKPTSSSCPLPPSEQGACPPGTDTVFLASSQSDTLFLDVEVPGGQQVYVNTDGSLGFTAAHAGVIPAGADATGFDTTEVSSSVSLGELGVSAFGGGGFAACPTNGVYQIFVNIPGIAADCIGFAAATAPYTAPANSTDLFGAWQYD